MNRLKTLMLLAAVTALLLWLGQLIGGQQGVAGGGGGQVVVKNGTVIGQVELKIAGLMSDEQVDVVARKAGTILQGFKSCGCHLNNPNMQLSLPGFGGYPELRISDKGLIDVSKFKVVPLLEG